MSVEIHGLRRYVIVFAILGTSLYIVGGLMCIFKLYENFSYYFGVGGLFILMVVLILGYVSAYQK